MPALLGRWKAVGLGLVVVAVVGVGLLLRPGPPPLPFGQFRDVTGAVGLRFRYDADRSPARRFIETTGGGCGFLDYDNDGRLDLVAVQGGPAPGSPPRPRPPHAVYRNTEDGFRDATLAAGLAVDVGYGQGVSAADYDGDGWTDLLLTTYGGARLFRNRGGRFAEVTRQAGLHLPGEPHWATSAAWNDYDHDGDLDLFVCHYVSWFPDADRRCFDARRRPIYCQPTVFPGDTSRLYRNEGNGAFTDATRPAGLAGLLGKALGAVWFDCDRDGWDDLFVAHDMAANWLLRNRADGTFEEIGARAGVATGPDGLPLSGMGVACADFSGDGWEDLFVVNFSLQPRSYFLNDGAGLFRWGSEWGAAGDARQPFLAFGVERMDYDLDGWPDLVVGNGHLDDVLDGDSGPVTYRQRQQLLRNRGDGRIADDLRAAGGLRLPRVTRGLAVGDYDDDGNVDCLVSGPGQPLTLFRNMGTRGRHWIGFRLRGRESNRDGVGAEVRVAVGGRYRLQSVRMGSSYCSRSDPRLVFGLDSAAAVDRVVVRWPRGRRQEFTGLAAGRYYCIDERGGCAPEVPPRRGAGGGSRKSAFLG